MERGVGRVIYVCICDMILNSDDPEFQKLPFDKQIGFLMEHFQCCLTKL